MTCNVYPLIPHLYIVKLGYEGVYLLFLFLSRRGSSNEYPQSPFWKKKNTIKNLQLKIFKFCNLRKFSILEGRVFVMQHSVVVIFVMLYLRARRLLRITTDI